MLNDIKLLLGITSTDKDTLLNLLITQCTDEAKSITGRTTVTDLTTVIEKMVVWNYNRLGTEGLDSENYSGASYNYSNSYPDSIMSLLDSLKDGYGKAYLKTW